MLRKIIESLTSNLKKVLRSERASIDFFNRSFFRVLATATHGYTSDNCSLKAAALTFYSLLSIIPVFAVAFGIAKGFGFDERLEHFVLAMFHDYPDLANKAMELTYNYLDQAKGGVIVGVGVIFLFWTTLLLLRRIEEALNDIWKVHEPRSFARMLGDYLAIIIFSPLFFAVSSSLSVYVISQIESLPQEMFIFQLLDKLFLFFIYLLPFLICWFVFSFAYFFIPNTRVDFLSALVGGVTAGTLYQIVQWIYIHFQINISQFGAIYGSFAAIPLFFIWLNMSWSIALFGGEIAYQMMIESEDRYVRAQLNTHRIDLSLRELAVYTASRCIKRFEQHNPPFSPNELALEIGISINSAHLVFSRLQESGILLPVKNRFWQKQYLPAFALQNLSITSVLEAISSDERKKYSVNHSKELALIQEKIAALDDEMEKSSNNLVLNALSDR